VGAAQGFAGFLLPGHGVDREEEGRRNEEHIKRDVPLARAPLYC
jgi:hypothetical protein